MRGKPQTSSPFGRRMNTMHTMRAEFPIQCPRCPAHISLPGTILAKIVQGRRVSTTGAPWLVLVCPECKAAFRYNYRGRRAVGVTDIPDQTEARCDVIWFSVPAECDGGCSGFQAELIAIRSANTTPEQLSEERKQWTTDDTYCQKGHRIIPPC